MSTEMAEQPVSTHAALNKPGSDAAIDAHVDSKGWALIETYIWDIGEDEETEKLIDKALRILLIHPKFKELFWKNKDNLEKIYVDETFAEVVSQIHQIIIKITGELVVAQIQNTSALSSLKKDIANIDLGRMIKHMAGKSSLGEEEMATDLTSDDEERIKKMSDGELYAEPETEKSAQKYAFWNMGVYTQLKSAFGINNKARESFLWSFLLSLACCIKYLEVEINAMPQFDLSKSNERSDEKQKIIWTGFIVPPTHGTVGVNYHVDDETIALKSKNTEYKSIGLRKPHTLQDVENNCAGCFVQMTEIHWYKGDDPYCTQCVKFRVYQECVRKFVLEYDNEETRDDLWPWYENSKNQIDQTDYKDILAMYSDQVLQIGSILDSNLKYYVPRSQTLEAAKHGSKSDVLTDGIDLTDAKNLLIKSRTQYQPYRNIRYLRKFAAMFLLGDREIWKDLLKVKKYLKRSRFSLSSPNSRNSPDRETLSADKSAIDDDVDFKINKEDRIHIEELLEEKDVRELLYGAGMETNKEHEQRILHRNAPIQYDPKVGLNNAMDVVFNPEDPQRFARAESAIKQNLNECRPGIEHFLKIWSRLPHWWEPIHDQVLLELALMHQLDVSEYYRALDDEEYYQELLEDSYYKAFEFWCTKEVNVSHRLRFLLYIIDQREYPESMIFMNSPMKLSHLQSFDVYEPKSPDSPLSGMSQKSFSRKQSQLFISDYGEQPVRNIEREFRDIVQLLEPEALGVRIWRFIMNQLAAKQRKSLWKALTILAEELPCNMVLTLLEEDRDLLRRGKPRYVNAVCQAVIKGSSYPTAAALHLARYMEENAYADLAREEIWNRFCGQYEDVAISLINMIESDHLLGMLLEIPTDIQQKTIIEMAVLYKRINFISSARIQGVMTHMWSESEFLNPHKDVRTSYLSVAEQYKLLWKSPVRYYYCPMGLYATTAMLYIAYLWLVSYISWVGIYPYVPYEVFSLETLMWICNLGYILYELLELESKRAQYFAMDSMINIFDTFISINWILLFLLRIGAYGLASDVEIVMEEGELTTTSTESYVGHPLIDPTIITSLIVNATDEDIEQSLLERTDPTRRNEQYTILYMALWGLQLIVLWIRVVGLLQRTEIMGPLLRMMIRVLKDVTSFLILVIAITLGFLFAIHYIVGGDIDRDVTCDLSYLGDDDCEEVSQALNSIRGIGIYLIQTLLGQQDWDVMDANALYGFDRGRAQLLTIIVLFYILMCTIISLNMLIAIMTTSFEMLNEEAQAQLAFLRVESTYDLAHRGRMMPPPYNIFVVGVWALITAINMLIKGLSCGRCKLNLDGINPYYIVCLRRGEQHGRSSIISRKSAGFKSGKGYSASKTKKEVEDEIHKMYTEHETQQQSTKHFAGISTLRLNKLTDLFEQIDSLSDDTRKRYCKHCYCRMKDIKDGRIENYFKLFDDEAQLGSGSNTNKSSFGLDRDDMRMITRLFRYCSLCPQCFRPYAIWSGTQQLDNIDLNTDRYDRHHVLMDVISCYFFLLLVWIPLVFLLFIPALFSRLFANVLKSERSGTNDKQFDAGAFGDYHGGIQQSNVKSIVDKQKYGGVKVFDDDYNSDDDDDDDDANIDDIRHETDKMQRLLVEIADKVSILQDPNYKPHNEQKRKKTTIQLQHKQKRKQKEQKRLAIERQKSENKEMDKEDIEEIQMDGIMNLTKLKKSIKSEKEILLNDIRDDNKEEEEQEAPKKVTINDENNVYSDENGDEDTEKP